MDSHVDLVLAMDPELCPASGFRTLPFLLDVKVDLLVSLEVVMVCKLHPAALVITFPWLVISMNLLEKPYTNGRRYSKRSLMS